MYRTYGSRAMHMYRTYGSRAMQELLPRSKCREILKAKVQDLSSGRDDINYMYRTYWQLIAPARTIGVGD